MAFPLLRYRPTLKKIPEENPDLAPGGDTASRTSDKLKSRFTASCQWLDSYSRISKGSRRESTCNKS